MVADSGLVTVATYGRAGSSSRVRIYDWLEHFGLNVPNFEYLGTPNLFVRTLMADWYRVPAAEARIRSAARTRPIDRLLMSREASPFSRGGLEARLLHAARHSVYDFDDAIWTDRRGGIHRVFPKPLIWRRAVAAADVVIAGSDVLADEASRHSRNVVMIPSCVEPEGYPGPASYDVDGSPVAVWIGSPTTEYHLTLISDALLELHALRGLRLKLISSGSRPLGPLEEMTDRVEWRIDEYAQQLANATIGLAPLVEDPFSVGKCAYKMLQYGAAGLPIVASPVGANGTVVEKLGGIAAGSRAQWVDAMVSIVDAPAGTRAEMGGIARAGVCSQYSFAAWSAQWRQVVLGDAS